MASTQFSLAFHDHSVTRAAYGKVLGILTRLQQQEECSPDLALLGALRLPEDRELFFSWMCNVSVLKVAQQSVPSAD
jgi:hypothetical protein